MSTSLDKKATLEDRSVPMWRAQVSSRCDDLMFQLDAQHKDGIIQKYLKYNHPRDGRQETRTRSFVDLSGGLRIPGMKQSILPGGERSAVKEILCISVFSCRL